MSWQESLIAYLTKTNPVQLLWSIIVGIILFLIIAAILNKVFGCEIKLNLFGLKLEIKGGKK